MFEEGKLSSKMKDSSIIWSEKNQPSFILAARGVFMGAGEGGAVLDSEGGVTAAGVGECDSGTQSSRNWNKLKTTLLESFFKKHFG